MKQKQKNTSIRKSTHQAQQVNTVIMSRPTMQQYKPESESNSFTQVMKLSKASKPSKKPIKSEWQRLRSFKLYNKLGKIYDSS